MARSVFLARLGYALVLILGIRVCYLLVRYVMGIGVERFHVESATFIFVTVGITFRLWRHVPDGQSSPRALPHPTIVFVALIALAFGLYWPALSIGFLSDDFLLGNLPDNVRGAYVFRVAAAEEFTRVLGIQTSVGDERGPCSFRWDARTSTFLRQ
jgi:hypothetical protein